jgi:hypothetical protein
MWAVVAVVGVPASAFYIGQYINPETGCIANPLYVDIDVESTPTHHCRWQQWLFTSTWDSPQSETFENPPAEYPWEVPRAELYAYRLNADPQHGGGSRNRGGGMAFVPGTYEFGPTTKGFGMNYLKLTLTNLAPDTRHLISLWGYEAQDVWAMSTDNPVSKFGVWSTVNPKAWLDAHGYDGSNPDEPPLGGYGPPAGGGTDSNMPCDLLNLSYRFNMISPEGDSSTDWCGGLDYRATVCAMSDSDGIIVLYGWIDPTDWSGCMHMPLNGFLVVPEPATICLLGLGTLILLRRKRSA